MAFVARPPRVRAVCDDSELGGGGGKRAAQHVTGEYLDEVLADVSGYIAADERYEGPFCVLSLVDNHTFRRLVCEVPDHDPTHKDIRRFFRRFKRILEARGLTLKGIPTEASPPYPTPLAEIFGGVPHQICEFHTLAELPQAILRASAKIRKTLAAGLPKLGRGRPGKALRRMARRGERLRKRIGELFRIATCWSNIA